MTDDEYECTNHPDGFVTKLASDGSALVWSTFLGGAGYDEAHGVAVDAQGDVVVTGVASGEHGFPLKDAFQRRGGRRRVVRRAGLVRRRVSSSGSPRPAGCARGRCWAGSATTSGRASRSTRRRRLGGGPGALPQLPGSSDAVQAAQAGGNCGGGGPCSPSAADGFLSEVREEATPAPSPLRADRAAGSRSTPSATRRRPRADVGAAACAPHRPPARPHAHRPAAGDAQCAAPRPVVARTAHARPWRLVARTADRGRRPLPGPAPQARRRLPAAGTGERRVWRCLLARRHHPLDGGATSSPG